MPDTKVQKAVVGDHDRIVMASRKPDGTPDQTSDFEYIGDRETTERAAKEQLREQAVSAVDVAERGVTGRAINEDENASKLPQTGPGSDPAIAELAAKHNAAAEAAASAAAAEVKAHFTKDPELDTSGASVKTSTSPAGKTESAPADDQG